jgi:uncharacterized protein
MIDGVFVVDATIHGFNFKEDNILYKPMVAMQPMMHAMSMDQWGPQDDRRYALNYDEFQNLFELQPNITEQVLFAESQTDVAVYHGVPMYGLFKDGSSPVWVAQRVAERLPHRMFVYGDISPYHPDPLGWIDTLMEHPSTIGLKFYPADMYRGEAVPILLNDEKKVFPIIEHARNRGLKVIAVHKAVGSVRQADIEFFAPTDLVPAIETFPDMTFEIVHGGYAFAEETAAIFAKYDNVTVNLETNPVFSLNSADRFAHMMADLLATGKHDKIFYATGATAIHPQPFLESFWRFQMPNGYPPLTEEMKAGMLGANFARMHGWDVDALLSKCRADQYGVEDKVLQAPWSTVPGHYDKQEAEWHP